MIYLKSIIIDNLASQTYVKGRTFALVIKHMAFSDNGYLLCFHASFSPFKERTCKESSCGQGDFLATSDGIQILRR